MNLLNPIKKHVQQLWPPVLTFGFFAVVAVSFFFVSHTSTAVAAVSCPDKQEVTFYGNRSSGGVGQFCEYGSPQCPSGYHLSSCGSPSLDAPLPSGPGTCSVSCTCESDDASCMGPPPGPTPPPPPSSGTPSGNIRANPNPCNITGSASACTSNITWNTDYVESVEVMVRKNNGPEALFSTSTDCGGVSCPAPWITRTPDYFDFILYGFSGGVRTALDTVRVTGIRQIPPDTQPQGNFENLTCNPVGSGGSIQGWAFDADSPSISIDVHIYKDGPAGNGGVFVGVIRADAYRPDVNTAFGITGNHGFYMSPLPATLRDGLTHQVYLYAINTNGSGPNPLLNGSPKPVQCPVQPTCPSTQLFAVVLADTTIRIGETTLAFAPNGWSGGTFTTSNAGVATVAAPQGSSAVVTAKAVGVTNIAGQGWTASNGATGCGLGSQQLFVEAAAVTGSVSANPNPITVCNPDTVGATNITATADSPAEVRIYNANGQPDGAVLFSILAYETKTIPTGNWVKNGTEFRLMTSGSGSKQIASVTVGVNTKDCSHVEKPVVELTANPNPVDYGGPTRLMWRQIGGPADECQATTGPGFNTNGATEGNTKSAPLFAESIFTIVCKGPGGSDTKNVTVGVRSEVGGPIDSWVDNTNTAGSSGLGVAVDCGTILATWTKAKASIEGYRIYYYNTSSASWVLLKQVPVAQVQRYGTRIGQAFAPPSVNIAYRYRVYTYRGAQEGVATQDAFGSPIAAVPCDAGEGDLSPSNKDIIQIRNKALNWDAKTTQDHAIEPALPIVAGDSVKFAINLVNGGTTAISTPIKVDDLLTNLSKPTTAGGFNLSVSCEVNGQCQLKNFAYDPATNRLSMIVAPTPGNSLAPLSGEVWTITFTAKTQAPAGQVGRPFRFRNVACLNLPAGVACEKEVTTPLLVTPYILVLPAGAPTFEEIQ